MRLKLKPVVPGFVRVLPLRLLLLLSMTALCHASTQGDSATSRNNGFQSLRLRKRVQGALSLLASLRAHVACVSRRALRTYRQTGRSEVRNRSLGYLVCSNRVWNRCDKAGFVGQIERQVQFLAGRITPSGGQPSIGVQMTYQALRVPAFLEQDSQIVMSVRVRRVKLQAA